MAYSSEARSSRTAASKPYAGFPLSRHSTGQWRKYIAGKTYYFGTDWREALARYKAQVDALQAGEEPQADPDRLTVRQLCNECLAAKDDQLQAGELSGRHFDDLKRTAQRMVEEFGGERAAAAVGPAAFAKYRATMAKRWGPARLGNEVARVRSIFTFGYKAGLLSDPPRFGPQFVKPSMKTMRLAKYVRGENLFTAAEVRKLIDAAPPAMRAMILLGINGALQPSDFGNLTTKAVDLDSGWIDFPRHKTGVARLIPLWAETLEAIQEALEVRPKPKPEFADLLLVTERGSAWWTSKTFTIGRHFKSLADSVGVNGGRGFATLRHTHRTVSDGARDQVAAMAIMGHVDSSISSHYRERIEPDRLVAIVEHVRAWLWEGV